MAAAKLNLTLKLLVVFYPVKIYSLEQCTLTFKARFTLNKKHRQKALYFATAGYVLTDKVVKTASANEA